jgi:hypothetical protein
MHAHAHAHARTYVDTQEFDRYTGYWWREGVSESGTHAILFEVVDETKVNHTPVVDYTMPASCDEFPCPLAGSANAKVRMHREPTAAFICLEHEFDRIFMAIHE